MVTSTKLKTIPAGYKIVDTAAGTFLQKKTRSRKKFKMSKQARNSIKASARRFKLPLLTTGAVIAGTWEPMQLLFMGDGRGAGQMLLRNYTGFNISAGGATEWRFRYMFNGLLPLVAVMAINKTGILKPVNQKLAKAKIPLRLS